MLPLTLAGASLIVAGAFAGGFASGLTGFGTGLIAMGFWLPILEPNQTAALVVVCSVVSQALALPYVYRTIQFRKIWSMIVGGAAGIPVGIALLNWLDPSAIRLSIGAFLILYSLSMLTMSASWRIHAGGQIGNAMVGFGGGILGGFAGLSGPLPVIWAQLQNWSKVESRAVFQAFNGSILLLVLAGYLAMGHFQGATLWSLGVALPATLVGTWCGVKTFSRLGNRGFDTALMVVLLVAGCVLTLQGLYQLA